MRESQNVESKLTPAAREALETLVDEYRDKIMSVAEQSATSPTGEILEITVRDIVSSVARDEDRRPTFSSRLGYVMEAYRLLGGITAIFGIAILVWTTFGIELDFTQQFALAITLGGIFFVVFPYFVQRLRQLKSVSSQQPRHGTGLQGMSDLSAVYINKWQQIERAVRDLAGYQLGESAARVPLSKLISELRQAEVLSALDEASLRELLTLRNRMVHESMDVEPDILKAAIVHADRILAKLTGVESTSVD